MRAFLVQPVLTPGALTELKNWLAISGSRDDAALLALLQTAVAMCEAFTRQLPLEVVCEELLSATHDWQTLVSCPVQAITGVDAVSLSGTHTPLASGDYALDLAADGTARVRVLAPALSGRIAVRCTAGIAPDWDSLPAALRHGIIRLAAHSFRQRDTSSPALTPPAAIAALWSGWRRLRLT